MSIFNRILDKVLGPRIDRAELRDTLVVVAAVVATVAVVNKILK